MKGETMVSPFLWRARQGGEDNMNDKRPTENHSFAHCAFVVEGPLVARFLLLLQQGVKIRRRVGCTVAAFLREELGAGLATIEKIQSIMLDGKPVDDIGSALIHDGSVLALSAAMPGLVGATLRRGGAYSSLRSVITYHETGEACKPGEGWVSIKLFNLMMAELGPGLLRQGVLVRSHDLADLLAERAEEFRRGCSVTLDNKSVDAGMIEGKRLLAGKDQVLLTVAAGSVNA
jgi:hypothetical protein